MFFYLKEPKAYFWRKSSKTLLFCDKSRTKDRPLHLMFPILET